TALACDAVGFAVLLLIDISAIRQLALIASLGVAVLVFTNLILLPVLLSYVGVSEKAAARSLREAESSGGRFGIWELLVRFTEKRWALAAIAVSLLLAGGGVWVARGLEIGDLDAGAPELRQQSRYNLDNAYLTAHY
ncbi:MMPL family transporter, partial [Pseudomonas aeruginosa]|uniref:MMPL family transporter n=1 Tax=Pseudomonas aeruginosa TaxID=287 RepID=UPI002F919C65